MRWKRLLLGGAGLVVASLVVLGDKRLQRADVRAGDLLRAIGSRFSDRMVAATTDLGSLYGVAGVSAALAASRQWERALDAAAAGGTAWIVAQGAKTRVQRQRPYEIDGVRRLIRAPAGSSYPSGHAAVATAMTGALAGPGPRRLRVLAHGLGAYVAASRVYVGVHYPSDVVGGVGLGMVLAALWRRSRVTVLRRALSAASAADLTRWQFDIPSGADDAVWMNGAWNSSEAQAPERHP